MSNVFPSYAQALRFAKPGQVILPLAPSGFVLVARVAVPASNVVVLRCSKVASRLAA